MYGVRSDSGAVFCRFVPVLKSEAGCPIMKAELFFFTKSVLKEAMSMRLLREPVTIKNVTLKNRLVMPPMATEKADRGAVTAATLAWYDEKSRGGFIGLVETEHCYVSPEGQASPCQLSISRDSDVEGLSRLVRTVHANGSPLVAQLNHAGSLAKEEVTELPAYGASAVTNPRRGTRAPVALDAAGLDKIVRDFAAAARRAKEAGFDGVELHSAHGYLLDQFYSPLTNRRGDEYGISPENRVRLHGRVIAAVREAVGDDYLVALRLGAGDYMPGGATAEDGARAAAFFERCGVDMISLSGGMCGYTVPGLDGEGYFSRLSAAVKEKVSVPVLLTGGVVTGAGAEKLLREGKADLIGVGHAILKDSGWARRVMGEER